MAAENRNERVEGTNSGDASATPTILHFGVVPLLAGIVSSPGQRVASAAILWGLLGLTGIVYEVIVARRMRTQSMYAPQFEDWVFHVVLPFGAYAMLAASVYATRSNAASAMFGAGAAALLLLFIGIHNAWDAVTYHIFIKRGGHE